MESCFAYFDNLKQNLQEDAQIRIAYHWRKLAKAKAKAKTKVTKGKKGKKGKKKAEPEKTPSISSS